MSLSCGSEDERFDCALGELTGTWRAQYAETNGSCGPIENETWILDPGAELPSGCEVLHQAISDDRCRADMAWICPTVDNLGTQEWVTVLEHVRPTRIAGTGTVQLVHPSVGACRSTYAITLDAL